MSYRENRSTGIGPISKDTVAVQFCIMLQTSESFFKLVVRLHAENLGTKGNDSKLQPI